jgi:hypothetical protein
MEAISESNDGCDGLKKGSHQAFIQDVIQAHQPQKEVDRQCSAKPPRDICGFIRWSVASDSEV